MKKPLSEADIQRTCADFLTLDGWRPLRTDPCSDRRRGTGFGEKGMADYLFVRYAGVPCGGDGCSGENCGPEFLAPAEVLWVEFKKPGGKNQPHQRTWQQAERMRGALVVVATEDFPPTVEGFMGWYRCSGLLRRQGL